MTITVTVTWMDSRQETYRCSEVRAEDGVLKIIQARYPASDEPLRCIPLANLRIWTVGE